MGYVHHHIKRTIRNPNTKEPSMKSNVDPLRIDAIKNSIPTTTQTNSRINTAVSRRNDSDFITSELSR